MKNKFKKSFLFHPSQVHIETNSGGVIVGIPHITLLDPVILPAYNTYNLYWFYLSANKMTLDTIGLRLHEQHPRRAPSFNVPVCP